jgi:hypothetical protein
MNIFVIKNWYHYDLNREIINYLNIKKNKTNSKVKERMDYDFKLKIE